VSLFKSIDAFQPKAGEYSLLPFRFEQLGDGEVVLTNAVGEFAFLKRSKLDQLVTRQLSPNDDSYAELRSKHFLKEQGDSVAIDLLALKTRTRYRGLRNFTNLHIFVVSLRCDHSCPYCQVSRQSQDKEAFDMTSQTAHRALELVFRSPNPAIKIEFQGGEPLLNFDLIREIVETAKKRNKIEKRELQFVIATTLSLLTDEVLEFCKEHEIYLSTSLDGPEDLHNGNRPRPGRDSYARFVDGLQRARDYLGYDSVSALMTTSPASLGRVKDIIDEYVRRGFRSIFLRSLSPYGFALKTKSYQAYGTDRWLDFYREGMDYILELNKNGISFSEQFSSILLAKMFTSQDPGYVDLMSPAGIGIAAVVFNYDGGVYASDESRMLQEMGDSTFRLGDVHVNSYAEIFGSPKLLEAIESSFPLSAPMCTDCAFEPWCGADPVFHHALFGDFLGRKPQSDFCKRTIGVARYLLEKIRTDPQALQIFRGWIESC
jgi:His-Xaa-Ser system radical SAM maturase HxsB